MSNEIQGDYRKVVTVEFEVGALGALIGSLNEWGETLPDRIERFSVDEYAPGKGTIVVTVETKP